MIKLALAAALLTPSTQTSSPPCLGRAEVNEVTYFLLPIALDELADKCRPALPANAYLLNGGRALSTRLKADSGAHWAAAMQALAKVGGSPVPRGVTQETTTQLFREMARGEFLGKLKPENCRDVNEVTELMAPLPVENIGGLVALLIRLGTADSGGQAPRNHDIRICREGTP
jgi:hypothetical protein